VLLLVSACSWRSPELGPSISGTVLVDGTPLPSGQIVFRPIGETAGPKVSARIRNGSFEIPKEHGIQPGEFQVIVTTLSSDVAAFQEGATHEEIAEAAKVPQRLISKDFNENSKLAYTVQKGRPNRCEFHVKWATGSR